MTAPFFPEALDESMPAWMAREDRGAVARTGFVAGTRIATPMGYVAVERLAPGDRVLSVDGRHIRLLWVGLTCREGCAATAPVRIATGMLDNMRPLRLGQGHRLRVSGRRAELMFGTGTALVTARSLVDGRDAVIEAQAGPVTYAHLMFDRPEIVLAENVGCETLGVDPETARQDMVAARFAA